MNLRKNVLKNELSSSWEGTYRRPKFYHQVPEAKILF